MSQSPSMSLLSMTFLGKPLAATLSMARPICTVVVTKRGDSNLSNG